MMKRLAAKAFRGLGLGGYGSDIRVRASDRFILGYPKSGNTWLDFMVASLRVGRVEEVTFATINDLVGDIHAVWPPRLLLRPSPRYLKSHAPYDPRISRAIYIARHPYAVAVSYYYYLQKMQKFGPELSLQDFVPIWIEGKADPLYGTWGAHVAGWLGQTASEQICLVRYEELKADAAGHPERIAGFLGLDVSSERIERAVQWCRAENMARLEREGISEGFKGFETARSDIPFVREKNSPARAQLSDADKASIAAAFGDSMKLLGYEP